MAMKSANVIARVNPKIKEEAEDIIHNLGLNASIVINALYRQIIINKGIPFAINEEPTYVEDMSDEVLEQLLIERIKNHNPEDSLSVDEVFEKLYEKIENDTKKLQDNNM